MTISPCRPRVGPVRLLLLLVSMALATGGPAAAAPQAAGSAGLSYLLDNRVHPGAICRYAGPTYPAALLDIRIGPPVVYARDLRDGRIDRQTVGWRYLIKGDKGIQFRSSVRKAGATDHVPASFGSRNWHAAAVTYTTEVLIRVSWYRAGRRVATRTLAPRYYRYQPWGTVFTGGCSS